jgi:pyroglutamyl-peptidase
MKLLLTGFEPFGGKDINASRQLVLALNDEHFPGVELHTAILPVDYLHGPRTLLATFGEVQPDVAICLGEARGRMRLSIERVAINLLDYRIADNGGRQIVDEPIIADGPAAYFTTLPVRRMLDSMAASNVPVELSLSAGAFLCNQVAYVLLHEVAIQRLVCRVGFIHLPLLPEQAAREPSPIPSLSLHTMRAGLCAAIASLTGRSMAQ